MISISSGIRLALCIQNSGFWWTIPPNDSAVKEEFGVLHQGLCLCYVIIENNVDQISGCVVAGEIFGSLRKSYQYSIS